MEWLYSPTTKGNGNVFCGSCSEEGPKYRVARGVDQRSATCPPKGRVKPLLGYQDVNGPRLEYSERTTLLLSRYKLYVCTTVMISLQPSSTCAFAYLIGYCMYDMCH